ncbi:MAG: ABC transporter permease [Thermoproteota archaeon]|nr:MAG: ABC transporter permease [Candidatus Korarchaeota archaeon]
MRRLRQILGIAVLRSRWIKRQYLWMFQGFVGVVGFTITLFVWGGTDAIRNLIIALFIVGAWGLGLNIVAQQIGWDRVYYALEFYVASPITLPTYFMGTVLGSTPFLLRNMLPATLTALLLGMKPSSLIPVLLLSAFSLVLGAFTSLSIVLRLKNPTNISAITNPLYTFTITLPPVYYPLTFLPPVLAKVALIMPTVSLMELARWLAGLPVACNPALPAVSLCFWIITVTILVARKFRWGQE